MDLKLFLPDSDTENVYHARDERIELKFILTPELKDQVASWAKQYMRPDPHCTATRGDSYEINTLYLDTAAQDIFHKTPPLGNTKYRLRRYAAEQTVWLESKFKQNNLVQKNRSAIPLAQLHCVKHPLSAGDHWPGEWFRNRVFQYDLQPSALVHYQRFARTSCYQDQIIRLTIDSKITGQQTSNWEIPPGCDASPSLLPDEQVLELKFHHTLPPLFKRLLLDIPLISTGFSKYRTALSSEITQTGLRNRADSI
ncbi:MAG: polyphosphate polymerase domain-containing protein [Planctomycetaceae bacterium]|nr:polyphosphate polymerase domain-containing protein [Planctomycetaceae bacterium]